MNCRREPTELGAAKTAQPQEHSQHLQQRSRERTETLAVTEAEEA